MAQSVLTMLLISSIQLWSVWRSFNVDIRCRNDFLMQNTFHQATSTQVTSWCSRNRHSTLAYVRCSLRNVRGKTKISYGIIAFTGRVIYWYAYSISLVFCAAKRPSGDGKLFFNDFSKKQKLPSPWFGLNAREYIWKVPQFLQDLLAQSCIVNTLHGTRRMKTTNNFDEAGMKSANILLQYIGKK